MVEPLYHELGGGPTEGPFFKSFTLIAAAHPLHRRFIGWWLILSAAVEPEGPDPAKPM